jgi:K+/H+ antiporter YhaU regulatory subunit KhtT
MPDNPWLVILAIIGAPAIMATLQHFLGRRDKRLDWERQDKVAAAVAEVKEETAEANAKVAAEVAEVKNVAEKGHKATDAKLEQIHVLVNSQMTEQIQMTLTATKLNLTLLKQSNSNENKELIESTEAEIARIERTLEERAAQTEKVDAEASR